jgi:hypothetical protein
MVFVGRVDARYRVPSGGVFHFKTRIVTVRTARDGLVWRNIDVADYSGTQTEVARDEARDKKCTLYFLADGPGLGDARRDLQHQDLASAAQVNGSPAPVRRIDLDIKQPRSRRQTHG